MEQGVFDHEDGDLKYELRFKFELDLSERKATLELSFAFDQRSSCQFKHAWNASLLVEALEIVRDQLVIFKPGEGR